MLYTRKILLNDQEMSIDFLSNKNVHFFCNA